MFDKKTEQSIIAFVFSKPRTVDEVATHIDKNWRTADRYIQRIVDETGILAVRIFREGSRGALKLVYAVSREQLAGTQFQESLLQSILRGRKKEDFSPLDIYQYVESKKRRAFLETQESEFSSKDQDIVGMFRSAQQSIIIFSGNLSWVNVSQGKTKVIDVLTEVAQRGVQLKVVSRVDIASIGNIEKLLALNNSMGKDVIELRHAEQPLRCFIIDGIQARLKETKVPEYYKKGELKDKTSIFYDIYDTEWVEWLRKIFFSLFASAVPAQKRLDAMSSIRRMGKEKR